MRMLADSKCRDNYDRQVEVSGRWRDFWSSLLRPNCFMPKRLAAELVGVALLLVAAFGVGGCANVSGSGKQPQGAVPAISAFGATQTTINSGASTTLSWATSGATKIAITPGTFTSTLASGSTSVSPTATTSLHFDGDELGGVVCANG